MSNMERTTGWQQIQLGVKEAERLITRKEYNLVMVKSRQVLEYMVRCMAEKACLVEGDLSDTIDELYDGCWISRESKDNYHTIRIIGNKAVHEGSNAAQDASQAYKLLTQEVYVFAEEFSGGQAARGQHRTARSASSGHPAGRQGASRPPVRQSGHPGSSAARSGSGAGARRRPAYSGNQRQGGPRRKKRRQAMPAFYMWRLLIPLLVIVLLIVVIRTLAPSGEKGKDKNQVTTSVSASPEVTTAPTQPAPTPAPQPETEAQTEAPAVKYKVKGTSVNVRKDPSKTSRILAQLTKGTEVDYVKRYNNDWDVINYNGQEAYVSSQFLEKEEQPAQTQASGTGTQAPAAGTTAAGTGA